MKPFALADPRCHSRTNNKSVIYRLSIRFCGTPDAHLRVRSWVVLVFLNRLQSGFLLFETQHGLVRVELSLWQRIYLLWTFRNFRQLSIPLLNPRQRTLVNALFRNSAGVVSPPHNLLPVIGIIENFVPPTVRIDASPAQRKERQEKVVAKRAEVGPTPKPVRSSSPIFAWSTLASTVAVLSLCIISVVVWHRIQAIPASQAHNQPRLQQINGIAVPNSPQSAKPATIVESPTAIGPSAATAQFPSLPRKLPSCRHRSPQSSQLRSARFASTMRPRLRTTLSPAKTTASRHRDRLCVSYIRSIRMSALAV
jgi:hypothetical protein